jgi:cytochrome c-type biogenesis protein CcmH/NrfG
MTKLQWTFIALAAILFIVLLFGFSNKPLDRKGIDQNRSLTLEPTDKNTLLREAAAKLSDDEIESIHFLDGQVAQAGADSAKAEALKALSGKWFKLQQPALAGIYAQEVAELRPSETAWSVAGTTFFSGIGAAGSPEKNREFCFKRAVNAFENAIGADPKATGPRLNLALCYVERPSASEPMKGIQMLLALLKKDPDNTAVLNTLARLALRTGQWQKAEERLNKSFALDGENPQTLRLLVQLYTDSGQADKAKQFEKLLQR